MEEDDDDDDDEVGFETVNLANTEFW